MKTIKQDVKKLLHSYANPSKAKVLRSFFKTGQGEYGEGDQFLGVTVPQVRAVAKQFLHLSLDEVSQLIKSPIHEERLAALLILVEQFKVADECARIKIYIFYLQHTQWVNNWDLVDASAHHIVGKYLEDKNKDVLKSLAKSKLLWDRRIAMVSTWHSIKQGQHEPALTIARMLLKDRHDLMHKAVGWMLREVGKHASEQELDNFLEKHHKTMPRTALRYAIERFPERKRQLYLKGLVQ